MRFSRVRLYCCLLFVSAVMLMVQGEGQAAAAKSREAAKVERRLKHSAPAPREITMSEDVRLVADWILRNDRQLGRPFIIADKTNGSLFAFKANGEMVAKGRALYGAVRTDEMTQEQADKTWDEMVEADKITPAGIFSAHGYVSPAYGDSIRFAEYANSNLLIHRAPAEWRRKNLQAPKADRIRVTYGCINVLPEFLDKALLPVFSGESTIFILPETQSPREFFAIDDSTTARLRTAAR
jgi:hypothetical protein